ncbi:chromate resistance protein [Desulfopila sp. IMCC35006]|nr:chromate resistance protein [Desulfopila sp. IMCC35006]
MFTMNSWIIFSYTVPASDARARMRIWRRVTAIGAVQLKTGLQILPYRDDLQEQVSWLIREVNNLGGEAVAVQCEKVEAVTNQQIEQLFQAQVDPEFTSIQEEARSLIDFMENRVNETSNKELFAALQKLRKRCEAVRERDFFPSGAAGKTLSVLDSISEQLRYPAKKTIPAMQLDPNDFSGRIWVTRARPYIDRLGSAWLIKKFIDLDAQFLFLQTGEMPDLDRDQLPFDMAVGDFTHQGELITFEVLIRDFSLKDPALDRISELVRCIDIQEETLPDDAALLKTIIDGLVATGQDDHQLLKQANLLFDSLYAGFMKTLQG